MKPEFREKLAQESFEEKIRKVGELIELSRRVKAERVTKDPHSHAIRYEKSAIGFAAKIKPGRALTYPKPIPSCAWLSISGQVLFLF
jgi:hypothetical protein